MIILKSFVNAFLHNDGKILLMRHSPGKTLFPGIWSGIGGHIEPHEFNTPLEACYREILEESGIHPYHISRLDLLYIILRRAGDEIRQSYIYFGETSQSDLAETEEGELFWSEKADLLNRQFSQTYAATLRHYLARKPGDTAVFTGAAGINGGRLNMAWACCEDFE